jgi:L,D-peptidoglycan transpeptidase YkuD (ErfK/YbiS/YcfS/YnhG family)
MDLHCPALRGSPTTKSMKEAILRPDGLLVLGDRRYRATFGRAGIARFKVEGDGATPAGLLPLRRVLYRADRGPPPRAACPIEPLSPEDGWCDDVRSPVYNRQIRRPFEARHEAMWREDSLYDIVGVLGWNDDPTEPERGSAIFLHLQSPGGDPTEGCVALPLSELREVLASGLTAIRVLGA